VDINPKEILPKNFSLKGSVTLEEAQSGILSFKNLILFFITMCAATCVMFMALNITKLGQAGDNEAERKKAVAGILYTGLGIAIFGGMDIVLAFLWNFAAGEIH